MTTPCFGRGWVRSRGGAHRGQMRVKEAGTVYTCCLGYLKIPGFTIWPSLLWIPGSPLHPPLRAWWASSAWCVYAEKCSWDPNASNRMRFPSMAFSSVTHKLTKLHLQLSNDFPSRTDQGAAFFWWWHPELSYHQGAFL